MVLAFLAIYVIWGSTYLAIRIAVESLPPFAMAGARFALAGGVLWLFGRAMGAAPLGRKDLGVALVSGALMLLGGNGAVVWAEQWVASGAAALLVAAVPLWMVLLDWASAGTRPGPRIMVGLAVGFLGLGLLLGAPEMSSRDQLRGGAAIMFGTVSWAVGTIYTRRWSFGVNGTMAAASQMFTGGLCLLFVSLLAGELRGFAVSEVTMRSWTGLVYLIVAGSIVAYSAYLWLLRVTTVTRVSTYAYVNPVVAVVLGSGFAGEEITPSGALAAVVIVLSVVLILTGSSRPGPRAVTPVERSP